MTRQAVRIFLEEQTLEHPKLNYSFDVLIEAETIVPKIHYFGLRGFYRGDPCEPVLLSPDGTIDFGSILGDDERWERTNLGRKRVRIGEAVSFWDGTDELPKSKDDERFYVIRNITSWGEQADGAIHRERNDTAAEKVAKPIRKRKPDSKPAHRRATAKQKQSKDSRKAKTKRKVK